MGYTLEVRSDGSIIWVTWNEDFDVEKDLISTIKKVRKLLDAAQGPIVEVTDIRKVNQNWDDMLRASNTTAHESPTHPNLVGRIVITDNEVSAAVAKNLDNETFGNMKIYPVSTPEEALTLARRMLE